MLLLVAYVTAIGALVAFVFWMGWFPVIVWMWGFLRDILLRVLGRADLPRRLD